MPRDDFDLDLSDSGQAGSILDFIENPSDSGNTGDEPSLDFSGDSQEGQSLDLDSMVADSDKPVDQPPPIDVQDLEGSEGNSGDGSDDDVGSGDQGAGSGSADADDTSDDDKVQDLEPDTSDDLDIDLGGEGGDSDDDDNDDDSSESTNYGALLNELYGIDVLETEDGDEVPVEEANLTRDEFLALAKTQAENIKKELTKGKVSVNELSPISQRLLEIEQAGGDISSALQSYNQFQSPMENLNFDSVKDQETAIRILHQAQSRNSEESQILIDRYKKDNLLKSKAEEASELVNDAFNKHLESIEEQAKVQSKERDERLKEYRGTLDDTFKGLGINEGKYKRELLDLATKQDKSSRTYGIDNIYRQMRANPVEAAELILFLTDRENYLKTKFNDLDRETKLEFLNKVKISQQGRQSSGMKIPNRKPKSKNRQSSKKSNEISLEDI